MLAKTKGIFLHQIKYSETSVIAKFYTREHGLKSFIIKGARSKNSKFRPNLFQPGNCFDMVLSIKENKSLHFIQELEYIPIPGYQGNDMAKTSIMLFLAEILLKCIKEEEANQGLFDFLDNAVHILGQKQGQVAFFPIAILVKLSDYLGFSIRESVNNQEESGVLGDLPAQIRDFITFCHNMPLQTENYPNLDKAAKKELLEKMVTYYETHLLNYGDIRSHKVLQAVL